MCQYCNDLDDYEARHGHRCDEECASRCDICNSRMCSYESVTSFDEDDFELEVCEECFYKENK